MRRRNGRKNGLPARRGLALLAGFVLLMCGITGAEEEEIDLLDLLNLSEMDETDIEEVEILPPTRHCWRGTSSGIPPPKAAP